MLILSYYTLYTCTELSQRTYKYVELLKEKNKSQKIKIKHLFMQFSEKTKEAFLKDH
jgi:hypothetical protein